MTVKLVMPEVPPIFKSALEACIKLPVPVKLDETVNPPEAVMLFVVPVVLFIVKFEKIVAFPLIDEVAAEKV